MNDLSNNKIKPLSFIRSYEYFVLFISSLLINVLGFILPLVMLQIFDRIIPQDASETLLWLALGTAIAFVFSSLLGILRQQIKIRLAARFEYVVTGHALDSILERHGQYDSMEQSKLHKQFKAISSIAASYFGPVLHLCIDLPFVFGYLVAIFVLHEKIGILISAALLGYFTLIALIRPLSNKSAKSRLEISSLRRKFIIECFSNINEIKAHTLEDKLIHDFDHQENKYQNASMRHDMINSLFGNFHFILRQILSYGIFIVGASFVVDGSISMGVLIATMLLSVRIIEISEESTEYWLMKQRLKLIREEVGYFMLHDDHGQTIEIRRQLPNGIIQIKDVSILPLGKTKEVVTEFTKEIKSNDFVFMLDDPSGAGTNLARAIAGTTHKRAGTIRVGDLDVIYGSNLYGFGLISYVDGNTDVIDGSLLENLSGFNEDRYQDAVNIATEIGLNEILTNLGDGYNTSMNGNHRYQISRSVLQIVVIIRALMVGPRILILNQVEGNLDSFGFAQLLKLMEMFKGRMTIVYVGKSSDIAHLSDEKIIFDGGSAAEEVEASA